MPNARPAAAAQNASEGLRATLLNDQFDGGSPAALQDNAGESGFGDQPDRRAGGRASVRTDR